MHVIKLVYSWVEWAFSCVHNSYMKPSLLLPFLFHSYDILGAGMLWKPKEAQILTNFIDQPVNIG